MLNEDAPSGRGGKAAGKGAQRGRWRVALFRLLIWAAVFLALILTLTAGWSGLVRVFLTHNPHFLLQTVKIEVTPGLQLRGEQMLAVLPTLGVRKGQDTLFAIDLPKLRKSLGARSVLIADMEVRRCLPGTLEIRIRERLPRARLGFAGDRLVDENGWILPGSPADAQKNLPVIYGFIRSPATVGEMVRDEFVRSALQCLRRLSTQPYGRLLDVKAIQIDPVQKTLCLNLHEKGSFRENAKVTIPADPAQMEEALVKVQEIARDRQYGQPTGSIDARYINNIPARP